MITSSTELGPENDCAGEASSNCKGRTRRLVRDWAPHQQTRNFLTVIKIWSKAPDGCFIPRYAGRLTVGRNIRLDSTRLEWVRYEIGTYGIKELDLASYRLESANSCKGSPRMEVLKSLCVIVPVIIWSVIIICSCDWWVFNKSIQLIRNPLITCRVTRIRDNMYRRVEAGSNTSSVALLAVGGNENGAQCLGV
jgi:hypothetical protein